MLKRFNQDEGLFEKDFFDARSKEQGFCRSYPRDTIYPRFKALATQIKDQFKPETVLDIGCAKGFLVSAFKELGVVAYGVDISEYAISCAQPEIKPYLYKVNLNKDVLPFEAEKFDFITCLETVEYLHNYKLTIQEAYRLLKPGGYFYLETSYLRNRRDRMRINIHSKSFWITEFEDNDRFKFIPHESVILDRARLAYIFRNFQWKGTLKVKLGKLLYNKGGYLGKEIAYFIGGKFGGTILFKKEGN